MISEKMVTYRIRYKELRTPFKMWEDMYVRQEEKLKQTNDSFIASD